MTTYTPELHNRLRELHQQASPAPWTADKDDDQRYLCPDGYEVINSGAAHIYTIDTKASVESRNALPILLDEIERLQNELEEQLTDREHEEWEIFVQAPIPTKENS